MAGQLTSRETSDTAAAFVARNSYGRLVAWLASRGGGLAAAEDALSEAFLKALERWPVDGVPDHPEAWLLTAARRNLIDADRGRRVRDAASGHIERAIEERAAAAPGADEVADERLRLMLVCAHPAIDPAIRTPLILQMVLGLTAERIAAAFLASPATMGQRLVRAKRKIADAGLGFPEPDPSYLAERLPPLLEAIYAALGTHFDAAGGGDPGLGEEALFLSRLVAELAPDSAEAHGLSALVAYIRARDAARAGGTYIPFDEQDPALWDRDLLIEADRRLTQAAAMRSPGRFQIEAAIQSAHLTRRLEGRDTLADIARLYDRLIAVAPSTGAEVARAAVLLAAGRPTEALVALDCIDADRAARHQPYWATRAQAAAAEGDARQAKDAFLRAIGLTENAAVRRFLMARMAHFVTEAGLANPDRRG